MAIYIFQPDALKRMAALEGADWLSRQAEDRTPYGFNAWRDAWQLKSECPTAEPEDSVRDFMSDPGDGAIYGQGGYNRYVVRTDGELVLLGWSASTHMRERAQQQGFTLG